jgi:hypothetical protein
MWAIGWPFFLAAWIFLFAVFASCFFGRKGAGTDDGKDRIRWQIVQRGLRWVFYLSVAFGGLILVVSLPSWIFWGQLHVRGVPVSAKVLSWSQEYDAEESRQFTRITYEFEAEVDGQRRLFQREGELRGVQLMGSGHVQVLHDPTDPANSRMALEFGDARDLLLSMASFLVLGVASFLLSRRLSYAGAATVNNRDKVPPADGTAVGRQGV